MSSIAIVPVMIVPIAPHVAMIVRQEISDLGRRSAGMNVAQTGGRERNRMLDLSVGWSVGTSRLLRARRRGFLNGGSKHDRPHRLHRRVLAWQNPR